MSREKLYTDEHAKRIVEMGYVGKPYQPSNGTEGEMFTERWCDHCVKDAAARRGDYANGCEIRAATYAFDIDDPDYPQEWTHDANGQPCCTAFAEEDADD